MGTQMNKQPGLSRIPPGQEAHNFCFLAANDVRSLGIAQLAGGTLDPDPWDQEKRQRADLGERFH